jgi:hypothetical protein
MRDAGGKLANGFEFLGLAELRFHLLMFKLTPLSFGDVAGHDDDSSNFAARIPHG